MESTAVAGSGASPFESLGELRREHDRLLAAVDRDVGQDLSRAAEFTAVLRHQADVAAFVARGAATGAYLDEPDERTACRALVEYWAAALARAGAAAPAARLAPFDANALPTLPDEACPYVGLEPFRTPTYFFGREAATRKLLEQILSLGLVVVSGASGSGKSSLVMGGALPTLRAREGAFRVLPPLTPGLDPLRSLANATAVAGVAPASAEELRRDPGWLAMALGGGTPPVVVTVDQFEEVFTIVSPEDRDGFVAALAALLTADAGHRLVLAVRKEFESRIAGLQALERWLTPDSWYAISPMTYDELRAAVERPAALANLRFQAGIVEDLVNKVLREGAALPLLQFTLRELWARRRRNRITGDVYEAVGNPLKALERSADGLYKALTPEMQDEVRRVLLELVRVDDLLEAYRQPVRRSRLLAAGSARTGDALAKLAQADFVTEIPGDVDAVVELKHEALVRNWRLLQEWIAQKRLDRRRRIVLTEAAQRWNEQGPTQKALLTRWQIAEAEQFADLSAVEREFVSASKAAQEEAEASRKRRYRFVLAGAFFLVVFVLVAGVFGELSRRLSEKAASLELAAVRLAEDRDKVQKGKDALEAERNAFAADVVACVPAVILIGSEGQRSRAEEVEARLGRSGVRVTGIRVGAAVASSEVRYFRVEDQARASQIAGMLTGYLGGREAVLSEAAGPPREFQIALGRDALLARLPPPDTTPKSDPGDLLVVLANDVDCATAADSFFRAREGVLRELGAEFDPSAFNLVAGSQKGTQYFVTVYGGRFDAARAGLLLKRLAAQPDLRRDLYTARRASFTDFRPQQTCDLRGAARARLSSLAAAYAAYRARTPPGDERTRGMESLFFSMRSAADVAALDPQEVAVLYEATSNPEGSRLAALAAIQGAPQPVHLPLVLRSIRSPLPSSAFEQYCALGALQRLEGALSEPQRRDALAALDAAWEGDVVHVRNDPSRKGTVERLRSEFGKSSR